MIATATESTPSTGQSALTNRIGTPCTRAWHRFKTIKTYKNSSFYAISFSLNYALLHHSQTLANLLDRVARPLLAVGTLRPLEQALYWCGRKAITFEPRLAMLRHNPLWQGAGLATRAIRYLYQYTIGLVSRLAGSRLNTTARIYHGSTEGLDDIPLQAREDFKAIFTELWNHYITQARSRFNYHARHSLEPLQDVLLQMIKIHGLHPHLKQQTLVEGLIAWILSSTTERENAPQQCRYQFYQSLMYDLSVYQIQSNITKALPPPPLPPEIAQELQRKGYDSYESSVAWSLYIQRCLMVENQRDAAYSCLKENDQLKHALTRVLSDIVASVYQRLKKQNGEQGSAPQTEQHPTTAVQQGQQYVTS